MKPVSAVQANIHITEEYLEGMDGAGVELVLNRPIRVKSNTGGFIATSSHPLPPQTFAIIGPQAGLRRAPEVPADVGQIAAYNLTLLGAHDADVKDNDTFTFEGGKYRVDFVFPDNYRGRYETVAVVVYEGQEDG